MCVRELEFIAFVASYGDKIVKCIGVFFGTRVAIELLFVFINEAFGMYDEDRPSIRRSDAGAAPCNHFASIRSTSARACSCSAPSRWTPRRSSPGRASSVWRGGLGAQSLVTDVVSGFFILFENWYHLRSAT